jgi:hypothetical protein
MASEPPSNTIDWLKWAQSQGEVKVTVGKLVGESKPPRIPPSHEWISALESEGMERQMLTYDCNRDIYMKGRGPPPAPLGFSSEAEKAIAMGNGGMYRDCIVYRKWYNEVGVNQAIRWQRENAKQTIKKEPKVEKQAPKEEEKPIWVAVPPCEKSGW